VTGELLSTELDGDIGQELVVEQTTIISVSVSVGVSILSQDSDLLSLLPAALSVVMSEIRSSKLYFEIG
jgi:hypothetical protein